MGSIRRGPPAELLLAVAARCGARTFVETGTFEGTTARWASTQFDRVVTIERSTELHERVSARSVGLANVEYLLGNSRDLLPKAVSELSGRAVFWLDGHWSGGETAGAGDECPLIDELAAIQASATVHALFIDDARLFTSAPPAPHDPDQWPSLDEIILALQTPERRYAIAIIEDVLVAVPPECRPELVGYARRLNRSRRRTILAATVRGAADGIVRRMRMGSG